MKIELNPRIFFDKAKQQLGGIRNKLCSKITVIYYFTSYLLRMLLNKIK